jgi:hypothetical protein
LLEIVTYGRSGWFGGRVGWAKYIAWNCSTLSELKLKLALARKIELTQLTARFNHRRSFIKSSALSASWLGAKLYVFFVNCQEENATFSTNL